MRLISLFLLATLVASSAWADPADSQVQFHPTWESLNARSVPKWFSDDKFGIFIHWGVYAVPSYCDTSTYSEWYQHWVSTNAHDGLERKFHERVYGKDYEYRDFAPMIRAELYDPQEWAKIFKRSGARYVVLTSKHHDGFCLWPNKVASEVRGYAWNSVETGPQRDLLGDLTKAVRSEGLKMGYYFSFLEWENPLYDSDRDAYVDRVALPQMRELINNYQPDILWPDGEWVSSDTMLRSTEFLAWLYNHSPNRETIVVNDRWGKGLRGKCGDFFTTEYGKWGGEGVGQGRKSFEECRGIGHSFAFNRAEKYDIYASRTASVRLLIDIVSQGGNLLLDIGPTADGRVPLIMQDRLFTIGRWLEVNGDSIYGTTRSPFKELSWGRATVKGNTIYLHVYDWPEDGLLEVPPLANKITGAYLLADQQRQPLSIKSLSTKGSSVDQSGYHPELHATDVVLELDGPPKRL